MTNKTCYNLFEYAEPIDAWKRIRPRLIVKELPMTDQVVRLVYPESMLSVPVINQLIREYELTVNILRAQIGGEERWLEIQLAGNPVIIDEAIEWLKQQGIQVQDPI